MYASGGQKLLRRPDSNAFSKKHNKRPHSARASQSDAYNRSTMYGSEPLNKQRTVSHRKSTEKLVPERQNGNALVQLYKMCALKSMQKIHPAVIYPLKYNCELALDMDSLTDNQEQSLIDFVAKATNGLQSMRIWSSYTRLPDVDGMIKSQRDDFMEYLRVAVKHFFTKIKIQAKIEPRAPQSVQPFRKFSVDIIENTKLMNSIERNLSHTKTLHDLTLCGFRMNEASAKKLNDGVMKC